MKQLPAIAAILGVLSAPMLLTSCYTQQRQRLEKWDREILAPLEQTKQELQRLQQAAASCTSMEWHVVVTSYPDARKVSGDKSMYWRWEVGAPRVEKFTRPVSQTDTKVIRRLLLHKLTSVPEAHPDMITLPGEMETSIELRFLDARGQTIHTFNYMDVSPDKPALTSPSGKVQSYMKKFVLPAADYTTWEKILPADIRNTIDKRFKQWLRRHDRFLHPGE